MPNLPNPIRGAGKLLRSVGSIFGEGNPFAPGAFDRGQNEFRDVDPDGTNAGQAWLAQNFASTGEDNFNRGGQNMLATANRLNAQALGQDSLSAEQLRQAQQAQIAGQRSMAAGARPTNAAMAARTAAIQSGRIGAGLAGQQAMAGIAERTAANQQLAQLQTQQRQQDLMAALQARELAQSGYGSIERERGERFNALTGVPRAAEHITGAISGGAALLAGRK